MTLAELLAGINDKRDFTEAELTAFLTSGDRAERTASHAAIAKTAIRRALEAVADLAREQAYADQPTLNVVQRLAEISDWDEPFVETIKQLGIQAADRGQIDAAMGYLQEAVNRGFAAGQKRDPRSRLAMRFAHDVQIDRAIERLSGFISPPAMRPSPANPQRIACVCSILADEDGPSVMTVKRARYFKELGFDVEIVSTGMGASSGSRAVQSAHALGIAFTECPRGTWRERLDWLTGYFGSKQPDAAVYLTSAVDNLAKLLSCVRVAAVQTYDVRALEPRVGKFDLIAHGVSLEQETNTGWPQLSRFVGGGVAMADEIDAAAPMNKAELGVPADGIVLATFGRIEKCDTPVYLEALARILQAEPAAWLVLAGPDSMNRMSAMREYFEKRGVAERVRYLGMRQADAPRLVKSIDLYCDTYPWTGGQSLMDAMQGGRAIVGMRRAADSDLDPTGAGAMVATAETRLEGIAPLAPAGDVDAYVQIARRYLAEPQLRAADGARLRDRAIERYSLRKSTARFASLIKELIEKSVPAR